MVTGRFVAVARVDVEPRMDTILAGFWVEHRWNILRTSSFHWVRVPVRIELPSFCRLPALLLVPVMTSGLAGQTGFHEPFDYSPPGADLLGQDGGSGFLGPWYASGFNAPIHDSHDLAAGSLSLDGGDAAGGRIRSAATTAISGLGRDLLSPVGTNDFATFYWSFLVRPEGTLGGGALNGFFGVY